jgi:hypothetical protein
MTTQRYDCPRCHGMMVEAYSDLTSPDGAGHESIGRRCVNCGEHVGQRFSRIVGRSREFPPPPPPPSGIERVM